MHSVVLIVSNHPQQPGVAHQVPPGQEMEWFTQLWAPWLAWAQATRSQIKKLESYILICKRIKLAMENFLNTYDNGPGRPFRHPQDAARFLARLVNQTRRELIHLVQKAKSLGVMDPALDFEDHFRKTMHVQWLRRILSDFEYYIPQIGGHIARAEQLLRENQTVIQEGMARYQMGLAAIKVIIVPTEDKQNLLPAPAAIPTAQTDPDHSTISVAEIPRPKTVHRRKQRPQAEAAAQTPPKTPAKDWQLFVVNNDYEYGEKLPSDRNQAIEYLRKVFEKRRLSQKKCHRIYDKIVKMCQLDVKVRYLKMDKIGGDNFTSWYKLLFASYRIYITWNDAERTVRFIPTPHEFYRDLFRK